MRLLLPHKVGGRLLIEGDAFQKAPPALVANSNALLIVKIALITNFWISLPM